MCYTVWNCRGTSRDYAKLSVSDKLALKHFAFSDKTHILRKGYECAGVDDVCQRNGL